MCSQPSISVTLPHLNRDSGGRPGGVLLTINHSQFLASLPFPDTEDTGFEVGQRAGDRRAIS